MSVATAENMDVQRPVIMFIDDEQRVLKSMRAMFRKDYDVHLANSGAEALEIIAAHEIDVVVSDQRMPEMTGVEVLTEIKQRSPNTVRILLTGYADLAAVEASINEAEVFKYLMKPCPAEEVRGAVREGLELRAGALPLTEVVTVAEPEPESEPEQTNVTPIQTARKPRVIPAQTAASAVASRSMESVQVLVLSEDKALFKGISEACPTHKLHHAASLDAALELVRQHPIGVLVTDVGVDEKEIADLSRAVRQVIPELVIILASDRSDANVLIQLINSGQVFRFLLKPLQIGQCKIWLASAFRRFVDSGGRAALSPMDVTVVEPGMWARFRNWLLGVRS